MKTKLTANMLASLAILAIPATVALRAATIRIVQTNAAGDSVMLIDPVTNKVVGEIAGIEVNHGAAVAPDGSRFYITVDFATHKVADTIKAPEVPAAERVTEGLQGSPSHGLAVSPDGKMLCSLSKMNTRVYMYSLPDLKLLGETKVGHHPDWLTFTPDGKRVYVANAGSNSVSVVDVTTRKELMQIPVGQVPKRNITAVLP